jgi:FAD dependent oxidoreductase TIGR03364
VFERHPAAGGASIRNFGMLWPIGQPSGRMHQLALRSRDLWLEVLGSSGLWHAHCGSLHLAYREDEGRVLAEFAEWAPSANYQCKLLQRSEVEQLSPVVNSDGLIAGLWSDAEVCVDPREVIANLPAWLHRELGVQFEFSCPVTSYEQPTVVAGGKEWSARQLVVCSGDELNLLYPDVFTEFGLSRCKLQMMRSESFGEQLRLGPMLAAGLTLRHYKCFQDCPSLTTVKARVARESPELDRYGIHVMASQNGRGEIVIGDSHEYDGHVSPFDKPEIDRLILEYLHTFLNVPELRIAEHWHGIYVKHPSEPYVVARPAPGATIVAGLGGAGMTLSFGLAEQVVREMER